MRSLLIIVAILFLLIFLGTRWYFEERSHSHGPMSHTHGESPEHHNHNSID